MVDEIKDVMTEIAPKPGDTQVVTFIKLSAALGLPSVLVIIYLVFISIPDADARREADKQVNQTLSELSRNFTLLNEQARSTSEAVRTGIDASRSSVEAVKELRMALDKQTTILEKTAADQVKYWEEYNRGKVKP